LNYSYLFEVEEPIGSDEINRSQVMTNPHI